MVAIDNDNVDIVLVEFVDGSDTGWEDGGVHLWACTIHEHALHRRRFYLGCTFEDTRGNHFCGLYLLVERNRPLSNLLEDVLKWLILVDLNPGWFSLFLISCVHSLQLFLHPRLIVKVQGASLHAFPCKFIGLGPSLHMISFLSDPFLEVSFNHPHYLLRVIPILKSVIVDIIRYLIQFLLGPCLNLLKMHLFLQNPKHINLLLIATLLAFLFGKGFSPW